MDDFTTQILEVQKVRLQVYYRNREPVNGSLICFHQASLEIIARVLTHQGKYHILGNITGTLLDILYYIQIYVIRHDFSVRTLI